MADMAADPTCPAPDRAVLATAATTVELIAAAEALGEDVVVEALDDAVHDVTSAEAAERVNAGAVPDTLDALDDAHDLAALDASAINNSGIATQIRFLVDAIGFAATRALLAEP